jgi:hypothetical protein
MLHRSLSRHFRWVLLLIAGVIAAACQNNGGVQVVEGIATDTLAPIVSMTPRFTATPVPSRTPLPTFTLTPSNTPLSPTPSNTPTPTATPPITGIVASLQTVNVRQGPGIEFNAIIALTPGTGVMILGQNEDGRWLNIRLDDGREGWISAALLRVNPTPTLVPTATPSPDMTALALGTPLPTAVLGGGTVTPTPPLSVVTPSPVGATLAAPPVTTTSGAPPLPVIDVTAINLTATSLALPTTTPTFTPLPAISATPSVPFIGVTFTPAPGSGGEGSTNQQQGVDVLAYCDNRNFGRPAPTNLLAGATIDIFWGWYASTRELIQQHVDNVIYDVRIDGVALTNWRQYASSIRVERDGNYHIYWYVPYGPLAAGEHKITYSVTWSQQITDGYDFFGPGTNRASESGTCTFTVR